MYKVLACLRDQHDYRLVLLAVLICGLASYTAFHIYSSARQSRGSKRLGWIFLTGVATGAGIWATHFVAMLAFKTGLPTAYDPILTLASLLIAMGVTAIGFLIAVQGDTRWYPAAGGAVIGLGIADMHYTGMRAFSTTGTVSWDASIVVASIVLGVVFASVALVAFHASPRKWAAASAAGLLTIAICSLHFTAMGAAIVTPDPTIVVYPSFIDNSTMALAVAGVSSLVILAALAAALIDKETVRESVIRLHELADAAAEGIVVAKDGEIINVNQRVSELSERSADQLFGKRVFGDLLVVTSHPYCAVGGHRIETLMITASGGAVPVEVIWKPYKSGIRANEVYAIRDLQERRQAEETIRHLAHYDPLTGLANRATLRRRLDNVVGEAEADGRAFGVLCIDLDRFKEVNDLYGHGAGDQVLRICADRMSHTSKPGEFLGRVGGDEFVIVQTESQQPASAAALAARLIEVFETPFEVDGTSTDVGASIGIALYLDNGRTAEQLLANADMALYRAKNAGRGGACFFEPEMDMAVRRRRRLAQELRVALLEHQFELYYQTQVRIPSVEIMGFEALIRWHHPEHGLVLPGEFIPIAEESGLIVPIGEWVLRTACREAATWPRPYKVAVNLSPRQFQHADFPGVVHHILIETGLSPARLELEITETTLFEDLQRALDALRRLRALGVSIAMDDFGTGYSSLSSLQVFPFNKIKIDRQFVEHLGERKQAAMIVRSVLGLGKSLDIPVLAEGVETLQQLEFLHSAACEEVQGFYFGRAASAEQIHKIIASGYAQVQTLAEDLPAPEEISPRGKLTPIAGGKTGTRRGRRPSAA
ncbi:MAG TPA: bifunctional diguanylate cyclase/phosphodiesterase [Rhizobiales bacterium]|nr:bifunctional diguanylate cyclase/phosphodiesterase [Hyphomicrobiales bacterium]